MHAHTAGHSISFTLRALPFCLGWTVAIIFGKEEGWSLTSFQAMCLSAALCVSVSWQTTTLFKRLGGHKLCTGTCNLQTLVSLFWCWYLQNRHRGSLMSQVGKHQLFWAIFTQRNNRQGPFGAQCPKDHWWIKLMLSMNKLGCNQRTDHGKKEEPLPKIPMMVLTVFRTYATETTTTSTLWKPVSCVCLCKVMPALGCEIEWCKVRMQI